MRLTHLGHSCLLVESADVRVLVDPGTFSHGFTELRDLDAVVVTHQHADHLDPERLPDVLRANPDARVLVEAEALAQNPDLATYDAQAFTAGTDVTLGDLRLRGVGDRHAVINEFLPRVGNTGLVVSADGEPTLLHPGDAYDAPVEGIDVLALPVNAPWCASKETIAFARRIAPRTMVPIHDALLSATGRGLYLDHARNFSLDDTQLVDFGDGEPVEVAGH